MFESKAQKEAELIAERNKLIDAQEKAEKKEDKWNCSDHGYGEEIEKELGYTGSEDLVAEALLATNEPRYVRLGKYLKEINDMKNIRDYKNITKAEVAADIEDIRDHVPRRSYFDGDIKTTYKQFKKIEKQKIKIDKEICKKTNKYKDVGHFISVDKVDVELELKALIEHKVYNDEGIINNGTYDPYISSIHDLQPSELTEFFDNCPELDFVDTSRLTKGNSK